MVGREYIVPNDPSEVREWPWVKDLPIVSCYKGNISQKNYKFWNPDDKNSILNPNLLDSD